MIFFVVSDHWDENEYERTTTLQESSPNVKVLLSIGVPDIGSKQIPARGKSLWQGKLYQQSLGIDLFSGGKARTIRIRNDDLYRKIYTIELLLKKVLFRESVSEQLTKRENNDK